MRHPYASTPSVGKDTIGNSRVFPSVPRLAVCDWRDLTYDSSIQILEMEEHSLIGQRNCTRPARDSNQTMSSISDESEVMYASATERECYSIKEFSGPSHVISSIDEMSGSDILGNTWDNLKEARLVSYLKEINEIKSYKSNVADNRKMYNKHEHVVRMNDKHLQRKYYSVSVLDLSKSTGNQAARVQTGSDVCLSSTNRKDVESTCSQRKTVPEMHEEPKLVNPIQEIRHDSKVGPVKRIKLRTHHRETRQKRQRRHGSLRTDANGKVQPFETYRPTPDFVNPNMSTLINATFKSLTNDRGSLSDFLLENETIPAINSATPIGDPRTHQYVKHLEPTVRRTPSLRTSRPRSVATSDLRDIQCRRSLKFDTPEMGVYSDPAIQMEQFNEYETVLNLCTRKPHMGLTAKTNEKAIVLDKHVIHGIKKAISKSIRHTSIKTNGTITMLPKSTKVRSHSTRSPKRIGLSPVGLRRSRSSVNSSTQYKYRSVFESVV